MCDPLCQFTDRLFFTTFPAPAPEQDVVNHYSKDSGYRPVIRGQPKAGPSTTPQDDATYHYFTLDEELNYLSFFQDWGPLNIAMVYRACLRIHGCCQDEDLARHRLVLYTSDEPQRKANMALIMALYIVVVLRRQPWEAYHPIAELEFMPFRDAGRGPSDFHLGIQDCLWGMWKAIQNGLCEMNDFNVDEYEHYEKVENGDWNWITPNFIAFASPQDPNWARKEKAGLTNGAPASPTKAGSTSLTLQRKLPLPQPFQNCLSYFKEKNVKLVIRLNDALYDNTTFEEQGIRHVELYFDDGTNPTDEIVRKFIDMSDAVIEDGGAVAVHCKAGLGRTGTLIGAYLIWKYGFTAHEAIGFMRIFRPGSVVGPQQHHLYMHQLEWAKWSAFDEVKRNQANQSVLLSSSSSVAVVAPATPPMESKELFEEPMDLSTTPNIMPASLPVAVVPIPSTPTRIPPVTPSKHIAAGNARARSIPPPGQPRKTPSGKRIATMTIDDSDEEMEDLQDLPLPQPDFGLSQPSPKKRPATRAAVAEAEHQKAAEEEKQQRPATRMSTRVTRASAAVTAAGTGGGGLRRPTSHARSLSHGKEKEKEQKIPRLAGGTTGRRKAHAHAAVTATSGRRSQLQTLPPGTPSRLPTLIPSKRTHSEDSTGVVKATWSKEEKPTAIPSRQKPERATLRVLRRRE